MVLGPLLSGNLDLSFDDFDLTFQDLDLTSRQFRLHFQ